MNLQSDNAYLLFLQVFVSLVKLDIHLVYITGGLNILRN